MLGEAPLDVVLLAPDLDASRDFYRDKVGLDIGFLSAFVEDIMIATT